MTRFTTFKKYFQLTSNGTTVKQVLKTNPKALVSIVAINNSFVSSPTAQAVTFYDNTGKPVYGPLYLSQIFRIIETFKDWYSIGWLSQGGTLDLYITEIVPENDEIRQTLEELSDEEINAEYDLEPLTSLMEMENATIVSTNTPLAANATYTSQFYSRNQLLTSNTISPFNGKVKAFAVSDQAFTLYLDYSSDGSTVDYSYEVASAAFASPYVAGNNGTNFAKATDEFIDYFVRLRIVNGATAQTVLRAVMSIEES